MGAKLVIRFICDRDIDNLGRTRRSIAMLDSLRVKEIEDVKVQSRPYCPQHHPKPQDTWEQYGFEQQDNFDELSIFELENHIFSQPRICPSKSPGYLGMDRYYSWSARSQQFETACRWVGTNQFYFCPAALFRETASFAASHAER